jgi:carboxylesterase
VRDQHPRLHHGDVHGRAEAVVAQREKHTKGNLVVLAPPVFIDGWATPWYRGLRPLLYAIPGIGRTMKIEEEDPFGIKNEQLRAIVKAKFERGENFHYRWVPLECIRQVDRLRGILMKGAKDIRCPTLVVHAREDELTSLRSANFLVEQIGGGRARMVVLEDSYHMICVDNDREIVAKNVLEFFGAALPGDVDARERAEDDPRSAARRPVRFAPSSAAVTSGFASSPSRSAWAQPALNKMSGAHMGKTFAAFASRITQGTRRASPRSARPPSIAASRWCRRRSSRSTMARHSNRRARCSSHSMAASCSRRAGSPTTSNARMLFSVKRSRTRPARFHSKRRSKPRPPRPRC